MFRSEFSMDGSAPKSWRLSTGQMFLMAAASLPLLASFAFCSLDRKQKPLADSIERPAIVFDQYLVNLGEIHNSARAEAHFRFKNCGTAPARITKVTPSCSCLSPRIEKRPYAPGEISDFTLAVLTTHQTPGPHEYQVTIEYEDPQPRVVTVTFKLIIRREVTIRPAQLIVYQNGIVETEQKVVLTDMRPKPFRVTSAKCQSPLVRVELGKPVDDPEGGRETTIVIHIAAKVPPEGEDCSVVLTTDDPHYPHIPVPIRIRDVHAKVTKPAATAERAEASHGATR
jgi:Protein of unknown function (DUF1573)